MSSTALWPVPIGSAMPIASKIPAHTAPPAAMNRFQELLKIKMAAEQDRSNPQILIAPATQGQSAHLASTWERLQGSDTVFNSTFTRQYYATSPGVQVPTKTFPMDASSQVSPDLQLMGRIKSEAPEPGPLPNQQMAATVPTSNDQVSADYRRMVTERIVDMFASSQVVFAHEAGPVQEQGAKPLSSSNMFDTADVAGTTAKCAQPPKSYLPTSQTAPIQYLQNTHYPTAWSNVRSSNAGSPMTTQNPPHDADQQLIDRMQSPSVRLAMNIQASQTGYSVMAPRDARPATPERSWNSYPRTASISDTPGLTSAASSQSPVPAQSLSTPQHRLHTCWNSVDIAYGSPAPHVLVKLEPSEEYTSVNFAKTEAFFPTLTSSVSGGAAPRTMQGYGLGAFIPMNEPVHLSGQAVYRSASSGETNGGAPTGNYGQGSGDSPGGSDGLGNGDVGAPNGDGGMSAGGSGGGDGSSGGDGGDGGDGRGGGQRAKKLALACQFCRRRKLKCDGQRPSCDNCNKRGENCVFDDQVRRRGPGKRTKEMRDRAAREAEAAGLINDNSAGPSSVNDVTLDSLPAIDPNIDPALAALDHVAMMSQMSALAGEPETLAEAEPLRGHKREVEGEHDEFADDFVLDKRARLDIDDHDVKQPVLGDL